VPGKRRPPRKSPLERGEGNRPPKFVGLKARRGYRQKEGPAYPLCQDVTTLTTGETDLRIRNRLGKGEGGGGKTVHAVGRDLKNGWERKTVLRTSCVPAFQEGPIRKGG